MLPETKHHKKARPVSAYSQRFTMLSLPSPSGLSMLYSGIHSRNNSSISTAFFSVNLIQNQVDSPPKTPSRREFTWRTHAEDFCPCCLQPRRTHYNIIIIDQELGTYMMTRLNMNALWSPALCEEHSGCFYVAFLHLSTKLGL